jgi:hypothetical protein
MSIIHIPHSHFYHVYHWKLSNKAILTIALYLALSVVVLALVALAISAMTIPMRVW